MSEIAFGELTTFVLDRVRTLPAEERKRAERKYHERRQRWVPNEGPQTEAYFCKADVLLYGGEPGGGKSQLILGLAFNEHERSLIMRRQYGDLDRLVEDALKIHGSRDGFNGSPPPKLRINERQTIDFAAAHRVGDEQGQMGKGRDFIGIDEATHFAERQIRFLMGWNRTENPLQRCRTVLATNPPLTAEGLWIIKMFAPWLDPQYPKPAKPGELRWVVSDDDGNDLWVDGPGEYDIVVAGVQKKAEAMSRTYIPASVKDNPYYVASGYEKQLDAMPEPYRSLLRGGFRTAFKDQQNQVIPTAWVKAAMARWKSKAPTGVPQCAIGVDASGGGVDPMIIAVRHDGWYDQLVEVPGKSIPMERAGRHCGGIVLSYRSDSSVVVVDMGGGYGGPLYEHLKDNLRLEPENVKAFKGAEATTRRSHDKKIGFPNKRSASYWVFREALDPGQPGGSPISLPDDPVLLADLTAPTFKPTPHGIQVEPKGVPDGEGWGDSRGVAARLGRSTDRGDAVVMAWFEGPKATNAILEWIGASQTEQGMVMRPRGQRGGQRAVVMSTRQQARRRG